MRWTKLGMSAAFSISAAVGATVVGTSTARADEVVVRESVYGGPNRTLFWSGVFTAGVPYVASTIVGAESDYSPDRALFIPIAGPWVDLAQRGGCPISSASCNTETLNKVFLVGDGILQGIGAITIVSAFLFPERGFR